MIQQLLDELCRYQRLPLSDAEEFQSWVWVRLVERAYAPLRAFRGRSSRRTYLRIVIHRYYLDYRNQAWGRWRSSLKARRLGRAALLLEKLIHRDGMRPEEAIEVLRINYSQKLSRKRLDQLVKELRRPPRPKLVRIEEALHLASGEDSEQQLFAREDRAAASKIQERLRGAIQRMGAQDRQLLQLRFSKGLRICEIAKLLGLPSKALYKRFDRLIQRLRGIADAMLERQPVNDRSACRRAIDLDLG